VEADRHTWVGVVIVVLCLIVISATWAWYGWLPEHRPALAAGERYGIDGSNHQGPIRWDEVAADDMAFAYLKATEGGDFVDQRFVENWEGAGDAGLDRGAYHFFTLCRPGAEQAANFLDVVPRDGELPPAIDLELAGNCSARPAREDVSIEVAAFLDAVESATGDSGGLYVGADFEGRYHPRDELDRPVWHFRFLLHPEFDRWWIWQVDGWAAIDGIDTPADLDVMRGDDPSDAPAR
jgi:lysozyme